MCPKAEHRSYKGLNNRAENAHQPIKMLPIEDWHLMQLRQFGMKLLKDFFLPKIQDYCIFTLSCH